MDAAAPVDGRRPTAHESLGAAATDGRRPTAPTGPDGGTLDESGQITCQTEAVNSLVNNTGRQEAGRRARLNTARMNASRTAVSESTGAPCGWFRRLPLTTSARRTGRLPAGACRAPFQPVAPQHRDRIAIRNPTVVMVVTAHPPRTAPTTMEHADTVGRADTTHVTREQFTVTNWHGIVISRQKSDASPTFAPRMVPTAPRFSGLAFTSCASGDGRVSCLHRARLTGSAGVPREDPDSQERRDNARLHPISQPFGGLHRSARRHLHPCVCCDAAGTGRSGSANR